MQAAKLVVMGACWISVMVAFGCGAKDDPCSPSRCVRLRICQRDVARAVQCMRGGDSVMLEVCRDPRAARLRALLARRPRRDARACKATPRRRLGLSAARASISCASPRWASCAA